MKEAAIGPILSGILKYTEDPIVSTDIVTDLTRRSSTPSRPRWSTGPSSSSSPGTTTSGVTPSAASSWRRRCFSRPRYVPDDPGSRSIGKASVREADVEGKRVLLRADLNVPLENGEVADDSRIRASLPTIELLRDRGASIVLVSHLGRPKGHDPSLSMAPVAKRLSELLGAPVEQAPAVVGADVKAMAEKLGQGEVLMLENSRFEEGETKNDPALAEALAELADVYVNDAFGTAHRAHATTEGVAHQLPGYAGLLLEQEVVQLERPPRRPPAAADHRPGRREGDRQARGDRPLPGLRRGGPDRRGDVLQLLQGRGPRHRQLPGRGRGRRGGEAGAGRG